MSGIKKPHIIIKTNKKGSINKQELVKEKKEDLESKKLVKSTVVPELPGTLSVSVTKKPESESGSPIELEDWPEERPFQPFRGDTVEDLVGEDNPLLQVLIEERLKEESITKGKEVAKEKKEDQEGFEAIEHKHIGDTAFQEFCTAMKHNKEERLLLQAFKDAKLLDSQKCFTLADLKISAGQIVALAGDFYGVPARPISLGKNKSNKIKRFREAYETLAQARTVEIESLLKEIEKEKAVICKALKERKDPATALRKEGSARNRAYSWITRYTYFGTHLHSRYVGLALQNFDHFGEEAREAYRIGHVVACATAKKAAKEKDKEKRAKLFIKALMQELFAGHFLTDLFAAGHMRTPRRRIFDHVMSTSHLPKKLYIAGLLAKEMHDEDSQIGLQVRHKETSDTWLAKGDDCYFTPENQKNREWAKEAIKVGLQGVCRTYCQALSKENTLPPSKSEDILQYVPESEEEKDKNPLFVVKESVVQVREEVNNPRCNKYTASWSPVEVLAARWAKINKPKSSTSAIETDSDEAEEEKRRKELLTQLEKWGAEEDSDLSAAPSSSCILL